MRRTYFIIISLFMLACSKPKEFISVQHIGELKQIMHQGRFEARVNTDTLIKEGLYALGALDSLSGELLIMNGQVYASEVLEDSLVIARDPSQTATLFVYSEVPKWDTINLSNQIDLEFYLNQNYAELAPFPFMLLGRPAVDYHVINFDAVNGDISKHKEGAYRGTMKDKNLQILGFYAADVKGIYTHHDSNLHMHLINADETIMGHVDRLDLENRVFQLLIPQL